MAEINSNQLLAGILKDLDEMLVTQKKQMVAGSNVPGGSGIIAADAKDVNALGNSIKVLSSAIIPLAKIKPKDIDNIADNIKKISMAISNIKFTKDDLKGFNNMMSAIGTVTNTFTKLTDNFFSSFRKFNPTKAKILGWRLGKFYNALFKAFDKAKFGGLFSKLGAKESKSASQGLIGVASLVDTLFKIDWKQLLKIGNALRIFPKSAGNKFAAFLWPIINLANALPENVVQKSSLLKLGGSQTVEANPRIAALISIIQALTTIPMSALITLNLMARTLDGNKGKKIGNFFNSFIKAITKDDPDGKKTKAASKMVNSVTKMIAVITGSLLLLTGLVAIAKPVTILAGIGLLMVVIGFALGVIKILGSKRMQGEIKQANKGIKGIMLLIGGLTLALGITVLIAKTTELKDLGKAALILIGIVSLALGVIFVLGLKGMQKKINTSIKAVGSILLLFLGMTIISTIAMLLGKNSKETFIGMAAITGMVLGAVGILWLLSKKVSIKNITKGLLALGAIVLIIVGVSFGMSLFNKFLKEFASIKGSDVAKGTGMMAGMLVGVAGAAIGLGALLSTPAGLFFIFGFAAIESIALMITSLSKAMILFIDFIKKINSLKPTDIDNALNMITKDGGMVDCIKRIVDALSKIGVKASLKMAGISLTLRPLFKTLSQFVDIIAKMGTLKMVDYYKEDGTPVYVKMPPTIFGEAATTLTNAFTTFITELSNGFDGIKNSKKLASIINQLFPKQRLFGKKSGIGEVINAMCSFVDVIYKMATLQIPDKWNKDGMPISYRKLSDTEIKSAATNITTLFVDFVEQLSAELDGKVTKGATKAIKRLGKSGLENVITSINGLIDPVMKMASGQIQINGEWVKVDITKCIANAGLLVKMLNSFILPISTISDIEIDQKNINNFISTFNKVKKLLISLIDTKLASKEFDNGAIHLNNGLNTIFNCVKQNAAKKMLFMRFISNIQDLIKSIYTLLPLNEHLETNIFKKLFITSSINLTSGLKILFNYIKSLSVKNKVFRNFKNNVQKLIESIDILLPIHEHLNKNIFKPLFVNGVRFLTQGLQVFFNYINKFKASLSRMRKFNNIAYLIKASFKQLGLLDKVLNGNVFNANFPTQMSSFTTGLKILNDFINDTSFSWFNYIDFYHAAGYIKGAINKFKYVTKWAPNRINQLANALKRLDAQLIGRNEERTKALKSISSNFKDMSDNIDQLNKVLNESLSLKTTYDKINGITAGTLFQRGANAIANATERVREAVVTVSNNSDKNEVKQEKGPSLTIIAETIAVAITDALNTWVEEHKDLTIQFDDKKVFAEMYGT